MASAETIPWSAEDLIAHLDEVVQIYANAMHYDDTTANWRRGSIAADTRRRDFCAVATMRQSELLGFSYGHRSAPGQWWHEQVRLALQPRDYRRWMTDTFELVELHIAPAAQGQGLGERQLRALLKTVPCRSVMLSTPDVDDDDSEQGSRAWRLYRRAGFVDVARQHLFTSDKRRFAVLGRDLPLDE